MRQGRSVLMLCAALLVAAAGLAPAAGAASKSGARAPAKSASTVAKSGNALRQFTGYVAAIDKGSITVERRGKKPVTRVFVKHAEMTSTGDVGRDARVTVFYRDEGGQSVARRVVVKPAAGGTRSK